MYFCRYPVWPNAFKRQHLTSVEHLQIWNNDILLKKTHISHAFRAGDNLISSRAGLLLFDAMWINKTFTKSSVCVICVSIRGRPLHKIYIYIMVIKYPKKSQPKSVIKLSWGQNCRQRDDTMSSRQYVYSNTRLESSIKCVCVKNKSTSVLTTEY